MFLYDLKVYKDPKNLSDRDLLVDYKKITGQYLTYAKRFDIWELIKNLNRIDKIKARLIDKNSLLIRYGDYTDRVVVEKRNQFRRCL